MLLSLLPTSYNLHRFLRQFSFVPVLVIALLISGCATIARDRMTDEELAQTIREAEAALAEVENKQPELPKLELDAELLAQLLIVNLASYQGVWEPAVENAFSAAHNTRDPRIARLAALLALRIKQYDTAAQAAQLWVELDTESQDARTTLLLSQVGAEMIDDALEGFAVQRGDKNLDDHIKEVAGLLVRQSNGDAAVAVVQHFTEQYPDSSQVHLSASYVADSFSNLELADKWLSRAIEISPNWDLAAQMRARMLREQGRTEELKEYIQQYVERNPDSVPMRLNLAAELSLEKDYDQALELVKQILIDDPENVSALSYGAALAQQLQQDELAKLYYEEAIKIDPANEEVRWALARYAVQDKQYDKAEQHYQAIESDENYLRAQLQVANMRFYTRSLKDAINTLRALDPETEAEYVDIAMTRHYLLMQGREYEEALGYINETLVYLPENTELKYARALVAAELKEIKTVESDLRFIIDRQPDHANALNALGYTLADQTDRYDEAMELITKALELRPTDAHILDSMGWVLYRMNDLEGALEYLQRAYDASPQAEVAAHLGEVLWESGRFEEAQAIWKQGAEDDAENPILVETLRRYGVELALES